MKFQWGTGVVGVEVLEGVVWKEREWWLKSGAFEIKIILRGFWLLLMLWARVCHMDIEIPKNYNRVCWRE